MTIHYCLCTHPLDKHPFGGRCKAPAGCECPYYEYDPFIELGPDGKPIVSFEMGVTDGDEDVEQLE